MSSGIVQVVGQVGGVSSLLSVNSSGKLLNADSAVLAKNTEILAKNAEIEVSADAILAKNTEILAKNTEIEVSADAILAKNTEILSKNSEIEISLDALIAANHTDLLSVVSTLGGTLSVSAPVITTTASTLKSAVSVANSATETTSSLDMGGVRNVMVLGGLDDTTGQIKVLVSSDDSNFYENSEQAIFVNSSGEYAKTMAIDARYVRFSYTNSSGGAKVLTLIASFKK